MSVLPDATAPAEGRGVAPEIDDALINDDDDLLRRYPTVYFASLTESDEAVDGLLAAFDRVVEGWS